MKNRNKITRFRFKLKAKRKKNLLFAKFIDINQLFRHFNCGNGSKKGQNNKNTNHHKFQNGHITCEKKENAVTLQPQNCN
ncbi:MAG: hypothetical protein IKZ00_08500 [Bacteroidaceae bacterium]|nr:hypothetical protein [Bacteroidaceae bacterium]